MLELKLHTTPQPFNHPFPIYNPPFGPENTTTIPPIGREIKFYVLFPQKVNTPNLTFLTNRDFSPITIFLSDLVLLGDCVVS